MELYQAEQIKCCGLFALEEGHAKLEAPGQGDKSWSAEIVDTTLILILAQGEK